MSLSSPALEPSRDFPALYRAAQAFTASLDLTEVAEAATRISATMLGARAAVLHLLDPATDALRVEGRFDAGGDPVPAAAEEAVARLVWRGGESLAIPDLGYDLRLDPPLRSPGMAALAAPLLRQGNVMGTLCLFRGAEAPEGTPAFTEADLRLLTALAEPASVGLENARQFHSAKHRAAELEALREIGQAVVARLDLPAVLEAVVAGGMRLLRSQSVQIILWDEGSRSLRYGAATGPQAERVRQQVFTLGLGVNGMVALTRKPMIVDDYARSPYALAEFRDVRATITIPVLFGDRLLGVLHSHTTEPGRRFTQDDLRLMTLLATQAAIAIENARLFQEAEQLAEAHLLRLKQIAILNEIGNAMQGTMHLDALLQVILTGVTFGGGLGFNRAILLLLDEGHGVLRARMGVGPASGEEAAQVWHSLASPTPRLGEVIAERAGQQRGREQSPFDRLARRLEIPLEREDSALAQAVREGRPIRVARGSEPGQPECVLLDVDEFAAVPLVAKGKVLGALVVDNKFNAKPITDADLELLSVFASQAGLAVEHAR
ncbi:MAG TPA: GAF domain-containing protein, partial [Candidatus Sulfotelmatobacter sp.]|nr:GAF domain-containing protein [Candidatus Sulfotelmatobacter sp.]